MSCVFVQVRTVQCLADGKGSVGTDFTAGTVADRTVSCGVSAIAFERAVSAVVRNIVTRSTRGVTLESRGNGGLWDRLHPR